MAVDYYDVWSDRHEPLLRFVVKQDAAVLGLFQSEYLKRISTVRVSDDIAAEVAANGYCSFKSNMKFDAGEILSFTLL